MINTPRTALYCASAVALIFNVSGTAFAQSVGQATSKVIAENEKMIVTDIVTRPGETSPMKSRLGQLSYAVQGGTFERTYSDGSKEAIIRKTGTALLNSEKRTYSLKNIGKTTIHMVTVVLK